MRYDSSPCHPVRYVKQTSRLSRRFWILLTFIEVLFLRVDTFLEDLLNILQDQEGKDKSNVNTDEVFALISTKDLGFLAAKSFLNPQKFKLPGKVNIDPVSSEIVSKRKLLERLRRQSLEDKEADMIPSASADRKMRTGMATTLQLLPSADNLSNWVGTYKR
jgi:hypothetical protein